VVPLRKSRIESTSLVIAVVLVTAAFFRLLLPYYGGVLWAVILAIFFRPLNLWLLAGTGGRRTLAAASCLLACIFIVLVPGAIVLNAVLEEVSRLYDRAGRIEFDIAAAIRSVWNSLPAFAVKALTWMGLGAPERLEAKVASVIGHIADMGAGLTVRLGQSTAQLAVNLGIMLYTLFFLFRDGATLVTAIRRASPLGERQTDQIFGQFASAVRATVKGSLIIAVLQGSCRGDFISGTK